MLRGLGMMSLMIDFLMLLNLRRKLVCHLKSTPLTCRWSAIFITRLSIEFPSINCLSTSSVTKNAHGHFNELILCFGLRDVGDILFFCEIRENGEPSDIRVSEGASLGAKCQCQFHQGRGLRPRSFVGD